MSTTYREALGQLNAAQKTAYGAPSVLPFRQSSRRLAGSPWLCPTR